MTADVHEGTQVARFVARDEDRHSAGIDGEKRVGRGDVGDSARVLPRRREDPSALAAQLLLVDVPGERQRGGARHSRRASMMRCRNCWVRGSRGAVKISVRRSLLEDRAFVEEADLVGDVARERHLVRSEDHRHSAGGKFADDLEHLCNQFRVERARDLVEEHQLRLHREGAHDRDALLLPSREPVWILVALLGEAKAREERCRTLVGLALRQAEGVTRGEGHIP